MQSLIIPFMVLSALGLALSAVVHTMTLLDMPVPWGESVMFLHLGVFVVFLPIVFIAQRAMRGVPQKQLWNVVLAGCPGWTKTLLMAGFAYALANFAVVALTAESSESTDQIPLRGFSGHWLLFYGFSYCAYYSLRKRPDLLEQRKCPAGHLVTQDAEYCSKCGTRLRAGQRL